MKTKNREAIRAAMEAMPLLTDFGFGTFEHPGSASGPDFEKQRRDLLESSWSEKSFEIACAFLRQLDKTKRVRAGAGTSYGLKHRASAWARQTGRCTGDCYITNGVFIAAMHACGFDIKPCSPNSPNAIGNIGSKMPKVEGWA